MRPAVKKSYKRLTTWRIEKRAPEKACKPGSVPRVSGATIISLGRRLLDASSGLTREPGRATRLLSYSALLQVGFTEPTWSPTPLVSSYLTVSPLPPFRAAVSSLWHCPWGCPPWELPSTLPCGARTFLPSRCRDRRSPGLLRRARSVYRRQRQRPSHSGCAGAP